MIDFLLSEDFWSLQTLRSWDAAKAKFNSYLNWQGLNFSSSAEVWALSKALSAGMNRACDG